MKERVLLMGAPGSGKTYQMVKVILYLEELGVPVHVIDLEDKMEPMVIGLAGKIPSNMTLYTAFSWEELKVGYADKTNTWHKSVLSEIEEKVNPGEWIAIDRVDLSWPMVQRWFTQQKYDEDLAERLMEKSKEMKKPSMFIPRFDQGSWQVINEQYESFMLSVLYKNRCNVILTAGIAAPGESDPRHLHSSLGVLPRGQKELGHQPHSVFLLRQQKRGRDYTWEISTWGDKDIIGRKRFEQDELLDFSLQYLGDYYQPEK